MKKLLLIVTLVIIISCGKEQSPSMEMYPVDSIMVESSIQVDSFETHIIDINEQLLKSDILENNIKKNINVVTTLKEQNIELKKELIATKDSIYKLKKELVEVKSKLPKKKNFIQKIFNISPDSVEILKFDTIEVE